LIRCKRLIPCIPHMVINPGNFAKRLEERGGGVRVR
jgi:hypothetical protein